MATSSNPLAPNPVTDIDGPDVFPPIEPVEDLGAGAPVIEPEDIETGHERPGEMTSATDIGIGRVWCDRRPCGVAFLFPDHEHGTQGDVFNE